MPSSHSVPPSPFTYSYRSKLVESYSDLIKAHLDEGIDPYFFNFMFNHISGNDQQRKDRMYEDVKRVHDLLSRQIVSNRKSDAWRHLLPIFILCPDFPVPKRIRGRIRAYNANEGMHINGVVLAPPPCPFYVPKGIRQHPALGKLSKLYEPLDLHFRRRMPQYLTEKLYRIEVTPLSRGTMANYALKAFTSGKVQYDDIRVF